MSDSIKHECGLILIRLRKPISYYQKKYNDPFFGLNKLYLLMEKQHNRGQDGAGVATMKLYTQPGYPFLNRARSNAKEPLPELFSTVFSDVEAIKKYEPGMFQYPGLMKGNMRFLGELILGHLRYGTQGQNDLEFCHPFLAYDPIPVRNIALAGNFNVVNVKELFAQVGIHPKKLHVESDLAAMLEVLKYYITKEDEKSPDHLDLVKVLKQAAPLFDGGYHLGGLIGNGDGFVLRDANGIRPSFYYVNEEIVVAASERPALQTVFDIPIEEVKELEPGHALIAKENGTVLNEEIIKPPKKRACSFERIYFSRGNDSDIYKERQSLGYTLAKKVLEMIDHDLAHTVFSFIPNTAEVAFYGLIKGLKHHQNDFKIKKIASWEKQINEEELRKLINNSIRIEKVVIKDVKMRTFITEDSSRDEMVKHVYDVTYGTLRPGKDTLVVIDDSIVRGTTLRKSILEMLDRLNPKRIIVLSSAPQIRYPDCYGIDMSKIGDFVVFRAAIDLLYERKEKYILSKVYGLCKEMERTNSLDAQNAVRLIYDHFTADELSERIAKIITPKGVNAQVDIVFQSIENLHKSCPDHLGDWYFTGDYPTPGGNRVVNRAFLNFMENKNERGY